MISQWDKELNFFASSPYFNLHFFICMSGAWKYFRLIQTNQNKPEINSGNLFFARLRFDNTDVAVSGRSASSCHAEFCKLKVIADV